jgi:NADPH:quinone reductase-like Zn-dependent oxidoreductase
MLTDANLCIPISKKVPLKQASMMFVNPMTALAFFDIYRKLPNSSKRQRAMINTAAASALGRMVIKLGRMYGIPVISIVRREEQVNMLKTEGAEHILNSSEPDFEDKLKEISHQLKATVVFDAIGGQMTRQLLNAVPDGSKIFVYGRLSTDECPILPGELVFNGKQIRGFWLIDYLKDKSFIQNVKTTKKIQSLLGKELSSKINAEFPIEKMEEALETYQNNMSKGKVLIRF